MKYLSLHNHTDRSNTRGRDSINKINDLLQYGHDLGLSGVAITDHENLGASLKAQQYLKAQRAKDKSWNNFKVLNGNEIYLCSDFVDKDHQPECYPHFIVSALDAEGYEQIRRLSTIAWKRSYMARGLMRVPTHYEDLRDIIQPNRGHVVASSACIGGALPRHLLEYRNTGDKDIFEQCKIWIEQENEIFGQDHFFLELQPSTNPDQIYVNKKLIELSKIIGNNYIITTDSHYLKAEDKPIHAAFLQAQNIEREVDAFYAYTYMMDENEIHSIMDESVGSDAVQKGLNNTHIIYDMAQEYELEKPLRIPYMCLDFTEPSKALYEKYINKIPLLKNFYESKYNADRHLCREITKSIERKEDLQNQKAYDAINLNLDYIINSDKAMNVHWSAYLLTCKNNVDTIWKYADSLVGAGRGSGVGFVLLYVLGITQINPLREEVQTFPWRFLNPQRQSVLDIDIDIMSTKRTSCLSAFKKVYGEEHVTQVLTLTTEKSRSAILTACRGLGVNNDYAQYIASLIVADRGLTRTLDQMYYGDDENGFKPDPAFVAEMNSHPKIWNTAKKIEGLVCGCGAHAGGVVLNDEDFEKSTSLMKTNNGITISSYDLHELESCSLIKYDLLSIDALDKIRATLDLLLKDHVIEWQGNLRDTYEKYLGIYTLKRTGTDMWKKLWDHKIISFFQMEKASGHKALALVKPTSVGDLAVINSAMRLMAPDKGAEQPLDKLARFKANINEWYKEMDSYGLTQKEQDVLKPILQSSYGICEAQEVLMQLVMLPEAGGFDLKWSDSLRRAVSKKKLKEYMRLQKEFFENAKKKNLSKNFVNYVWNVLIATQRGYGFDATRSAIQ